MNRPRDAADCQQALRAIREDPRYRDNIDFGEPRPGHPEGSIRAHIADLERNLKTLRPRLDEREYWQLKLLIHTHDTLKAVAREHVPIASPQSHASLAQRFLADYCNDADLLNMVQYHDEPYALWQQFKRRGRFDQNRLDALIARIEDWNIFLAFQIIDNCTKGKVRDPLYWLFQKVRGRVVTRFTKRDIL